MRYNICHGFVILLFVFHIIISCTARVIKELIINPVPWTDNLPDTCFSEEKKNYISQRTSQLEKEDTSQKSRDLALSALPLW